MFDFDRRGPEKRIKIPGLLDISKIYAEQEAVESPVGRDVLSRFPDARVEIVPGHGNIPGLFGNEGNVDRWNRIKGSVLVLGVKKGLHFVENGRSADYIAPSTANGCAMSCAYCYVPRNKGYANPITVFVNIDAICGAISRHSKKLGPKAHPNQVDERFWVYDVGCNSDCSVDALLSENVATLIEHFKRVPDAKASFATKYVNRGLLGLDPGGKTRIRFSLMPSSKAKLLDVRTAPVADRIAAIDDFVEAGYEVQLNFSPVVIYEGWREEYAELFDEVDSNIGEKAKRQMACEVIFLTHNESLHEINLGWHPKAEELLWTPDNQEPKVSERGGNNLRYRRGFKGAMVREFCDLVAEKLPYCRVRYAF
ncbi:spore photoproduct lyase family protein [Tundrisphaera lichenicola]|uniref:spore photoproduct lyase family protein n=1 Tax=Tundrisphaera lichenicola TaxID=2029860 RepID=UPI003EBDF9D3